MSNSSVVVEKPGSVHQEHLFEYNRVHQDNFQQQLDLTQDNIHARLFNPLAGIPPAQLEDEARSFAHSHGLSDEAFMICKGALVAQNPLGFNSINLLSEVEKLELRYEQICRWDQPKTLYYLVIVCSLAAAVQGMDETVINGANLDWPEQFKIQIDPNNPTTHGQWLLGLVASAPYLCCAVLGCWITDPMNKAFGRRGTIFITATLSCLTCFWQSFTNSWYHLFIARFALGLGIGPKSTTVPIYAAECAPTPVRGALVMMWQMWTAFGIMLGYAADLIFIDVRKEFKWRLMLGSAGVPAIFIMAQVYFCPESPRWLMSEGRYLEAFESLCCLRQTKLMAARDLYYIHRLLEEEKKSKRPGKPRALELFTVPRNRRAVIASFIVMILQQLCGVNVIAYYSSSVFKRVTGKDRDAMLFSWGFGMINFLFAIPAIYMIDTFGRRFLLLTTFPVMAICMLVTAMAFFVPDRYIYAKVGLTTVGIYVFGIFYSPGEGPVPFTYSAEAFPLYMRALGMSFATAACWFFNFLVCLTFPPMFEMFTHQGAFGWYAAWCCIGWVLILFLVPETKGLSLEELNQVFLVPTRVHAAYQLREIPIWFKVMILRRNNVQRQPPLYQHDERTAWVYASGGGGLP